jgi:hypothetical protein
MKIVRFDIKGHCQFIYFDWHDFKIKTSCWAENLAALFGNTRSKKHIIIGIWN